MKYTIEVWDDSVTGQEKIIRTYKFNDIEVAKSESRRLTDEDVNERYVFFLVDEDGEYIEF